jgi:cysteine-rich repeat protein
MQDIKIKVPYQLSTEDSLSLNLSQYECGEICGDGVLYKSTIPNVVSDHECDDGNTKAGDGCSVDCKIEKDFTCKRDYTPQHTSYKDWNLFFNDIDFCKLVTLGSFE